MKRMPAIAAASVVLAGLVALGFVAGRMTGHSLGETKAASRKVLYWVDPMHPSYKSDKPGIAPDCGMALEPVYEDGGDSSAVALPPGAVSLSSERQQLIGIRIGTVNRSSGFRTVRTTGRVTPDENTLYKVLAGTQGWIESLDDNPPGTLVKKGQQLAVLYSPDFRTAETTYLGFVVSLDRLKQSMSKDDQKLVEDSSRFNEEQLRLFGMGEEQLKQLRETRRQTSTINLGSPGDGIVLARSISPRQRFEIGQELFRIADLSKVWIVADIHGEDGEIPPGTHVKVNVPELGKTIVATVTSSTPLFDQATRTLKLRLEADNPGLLLRPDMFVDVEFQEKMPAGLSIPEDAVLDSGTRKIVYVQTSDGVFEPRPIEVSGTYGNQVMVARGLAEGEKIVISGNFLLDSESRMRMVASPSQPSDVAMDHKAMASMQTGAKMKPLTPAEAAKMVHDPVCGMSIKAGQARHTEEYNGKTIYFCSDACYNKFLANPSKYAANTQENQSDAKSRAAMNHD